MIRFIALSVVAAFVLTFSATAAGPIAYDGFDYTSGLNLTNAPAGGTGFSAGWEAGRADQGRWTVLSSGLSFGNLQVSGNAVGFDTWTTDNNFQNTDLSYVRQLSTDLRVPITGASVEYWYTWLYKDTSGYNSQALRLSVNDSLTANPMVFHGRAGQLQCR